jgi:cytochrome c
MVAVAGLTLLTLTIQADAARSPLTIQDATPQARSVADGVYLNDQAERGKKAYAAFCANCHADDLGGTNSADSGAPPLRREGFMEGSTVNALFMKVRRTMPADAPGALSEEDYIDILSFIFKENGFPAGREPLRPNAALLDSIKIVKKSN